MAMLGGGATRAIVAHHILGSYRKVEIYVGKDVYFYKEWDI
jgi:hypothetical protein